MHRRELWVDEQGDFNVPGIESELPEDVVRLARAFHGLPYEQIRFISRDAGWHLFEFRRSHPGEAAVVAIRYREIEPPCRITSRELDVLTLVALGLSNQSIAQRLGNSARTVSTQVETLLYKLRQDSRTALATLAVEQGYLRLPLPGGALPRRSVPSHVHLQNAAFGSPAHAPAPAPMIALEPETVRIGVVVPSAQAESDGHELLQGAGLAVEEINHVVGEHGRRALELVPFPADLFDPSSVGGAVASLLQTDLHALITSYAATEDLAVLEPVAEAGIPFLHTATQYSQLERVAQQPDRYGNFFQTCPPETFYGREFIDILQRLVASGRWSPPNRRFASVEVDSATTGITTGRLVDYARGRGWSLAEHVRVQRSGVDWAGVMSRLSREEPAVVLLTHFLPDELIDCYRAFLDSGLRALVLSVYGPSILEFQREFDGRADGILWSTTSGTYDDLLGSRFRNLFLGRYGTLPGWSQAGAAYDQVHLLARAWQAAGSVDPQRTIAQLRRITHRGVNGTYFLGGAGQTSLAYPYVTSDPSMGQAHMIYQIQGGTSRPLGPEPFGDVSGFALPWWMRDAA